MSRISRTNALAKAVKAASLMLAGACGTEPANITINLPEQPAPNVTVNVPEHETPEVNVTVEAPVTEPAVSLCGSSGTVDLSETRTMLNQNEGVVLSENHALVYAGATSENEAILRIADQRTGDTVREFVVDTDNTYEIRNGEEVLLIFAVCSVNAAVDFSANSAELATDREVVGYVNETNPSECSGSFIAGAVIGDEEAGTEYAERITTGTLADGRDVYRVEFEPGLPICTVPGPVDSADYAECEGEGESATARHRVKIAFMDGEWLVTQLTERQMTLARESMNSVVTQGESMDQGALKIRLSDVTEDGRAIINIEDASGTLLDSVMLTPGQTQDISIDGTAFALHVWATTPGYTFGSRWADMSVLSYQAHVNNGERLSGSDGIETAWNVEMNVTFDGKLASITLTAPEGTWTPRCE